MRKTFLTRAAVTATLLFVAGGASGHHGWAAFDAALTVTFKGTVTDFHFVSPHCVVEFDVKDEKGQVQKWQGEMTSSTHLRTYGWSATSLEAGDEITVSGYRTRNGTQVMRITKIAAKGRELKIGIGN